MFSAKPLRNVVVIPSQAIFAMVFVILTDMIEDLTQSVLLLLRVLKPGGKMIFCEHGLAPDAKVSKWQSRLDPVWGKIAGGCHLNRDIPSLIEDAGFNITSMEQMYLPSTPKFAGYNYWGTAVAR